MSKCPAWHEGNQGFEPFSYDRCYATKERETCECLGNEAFCDFYPEKRKAATKPKYGEWISVKDRLPKEWKADDGTLKNYLVYMPEYGVDVGNYLETAKTWVCMGFPVKVTHWMPLPEPPKEGSNETD